MAVWWQVGVPHWLGHPAADDMYVDSPHSPHLMFMHLHKTLDWLTLISSLSLPSSHPPLAYGIYRAH